MTKKSFVGSAIVLMIAGLIVRVLGFIYRIYLSNLIGAEGMGIFQLISPVYSLVYSLSLLVYQLLFKNGCRTDSKNNHVNLLRITYCIVAIVVIAGLSSINRHINFIDQ